jgi:hypothetical protein
MLLNPKPSTLDPFRPPVTPFFSFFFINLTPLEKLSTTYYAPLTLDGDRAPLQTSLGQDIARLR